MPLIECPTCGKHTLDGNDKCPYCGGLMDIRAIKEQEQLARQKVQEEEEYRKLAIEQEKQAILDMNPQYEYKVVKHTDNESGRIPSETIENTLNSMAKQGWRLVNSFTNEIGKESKSTSFLGVDSGTNATIDEVVLIFERCIKLAKV